MLKHLLFLLIYLPVGLGAQNQYNLSGYIEDAETGEILVGASIYLTSNPNIGTVTNAYGFYSLRLPEGSQKVSISYIGYAERIEDVNLNKDIRLNISLAEELLELETVVITAEDPEERVQSTQMSTQSLVMEQIKQLPALFGEVDVLKTLQLLPGVLSAGEGNAGFYVRGGGPDQNLVLLDEAVVYNAGHLLGFFSVFNADAIRNTTLIKGGMPANYGGRLSSVVDIQMKEGNKKKYQLDGGIGSIASRLTFQGPIVKDKSSFIISGRRTYVLDLAQPLLSGTTFEGTNYYFYDLNAKVNYQFSDRDRLFLSTYFGRDVLNFRNKTRDFAFDLEYGNTTTTLRWNHLFSDRMFMNVSLIYNDYDFGFEGGQDDFSANVFSGVRDYNAKVDFDYFPSPNHSIKFGANYTYHRLTPNIANASSGDVNFSNNLESKFAHESAIYILDDWKINEYLKVNVGLRASMFTQLGPYTAVDGTRFEAQEPVQDYYGLEPRVSTRWSWQSDRSIKASFALTQQYLHLVSNSTNTLPNDIWVPSSRRIKPQIAIQYAVGYFQNFQNNSYEASVELYYKDLQNQIDYRENYVNDIADELEREFVFGDGRAYGVELFVQKQKGAFNGWVGYTWSRTERTFPEINNGETYRATYDRTHDISVVANYELSPKWTVGGVFVYGTGNTFTPIESVYFIGQNFGQSYGPRNSARLEPYHRMDLSATYVRNPDKKGFQSKWSFSIYNVYSRLNPFFIYYTFDTDTATGTAEAEAIKVSLFPIIPAITWNFSWK